MFASLEVIEVDGGPRVLAFVTPPSIDPILTPIPSHVCAKLLDVCPSQYDQMVKAGTIRQSCYVSPFPGTSLIGPMKMSNFWDLLSAAVFRLFLETVGVGSAATRLSETLVDTLAEASDRSPLTGRVSIEELLDGCRGLEIFEKGLAVRTIFVVMNLAKRCCPKFVEADG